MNDLAEFSRTIRALETDHFRLGITGLLLIAAIFAGWTWWMFNACVSVQTEFVSLAALVLRAAGVPHR